MSKTQSLRLTGSTEIVTVPVQKVEGQDLVCWETIEQAFPGVQYVKNDDVAIPRYIKHVPEKVLHVVLSNTTERVRADAAATSSMAPEAALDSVQTVGGAISHANGSRDSSVDDNLVEGLQVASASETTLVDNNGIHSSSSDSSILPPSSVEATSKTVLSFIDVLKRASKKTKEADVQAPQQESDTKMAYMIKLLEASDAKQEELRQLQKQALDQQEEMKQLQKAADARQERMNQLQQQTLEQQEEMKQLAQGHHEEIKQLQIQALGQLAVLQSRVQAVLTQTYELHEYPIPRLFIVLPQYPSGWDVLQPFTEKYRLYFLCECGEHTKNPDSNSNIPHTIHLAKHEGYEISRPNEFFEQYGPYILTILKMLKFGISVASVAVPAVAHLMNTDALDHAAKGLEQLKNCIEPGMNEVISKMEKDSTNEGEAIEDFASQMESKEALEGADLRKLETFLKDKDENKVLGNLYRTVTDEGHVKWVCIDHYRENYKQTAAEAFRRAVDSLEGTFDENNGLVRVKLRSRVLANQFYMALRNARSVHELDIVFDWACTGTDIQALEDALRRSVVAVLRVDLRQFRPSLTSKLTSIPVRYEALYRIMDPPNMKSIHIVLPEDLIEPSNFTPKRPPHLREISFAIPVGSWIYVQVEALEPGSTSTTWHLRDGSERSNKPLTLTEGLSTRTSLDFSGDSIGNKGAEALSEALKINSTVTALGLRCTSIGGKGAQALSEALKTNSTLTTLDLASNWIGANGAQALSEAFKINSTLTTLFLRHNSIGDKGAQALSEALKFNSTLIALQLYGNSIGANGAQALSEALKTNSTLTSLDLGDNSIGANGAQALSEALKTNSTLTTLNLRDNSIEANGAQALSEALKTNSTLTTLCLRKNSIEANGAQALSKALKINSTLTFLYLEENWIGKSGAQVLSEALKTNSTLTNLYLKDNSIGDNGAQALSKALKINSTLTTLDLEDNSIELEGAQALSEALKTNSTLTTLDLYNNSIGDKGAQALSEALKTNSTLTSLNLHANSMGNSGAKALREAGKANATVTVKF
ncbi:unnamed protein product [Mortierella alpina]